MRPMLKVHGIKRTKLCNDEPPSNFAFKINLRRYNSVATVKTEWPAGDYQMYLHGRGSHSSTSQLNVCRFCH